MKTSSVIILAIAALLGLLLGYGLGTNPTESILWALGLGIVSVGAAYYTIMRAEKATDTPVDTTVHINDPPIAKFLFTDTRAAALWLPVRFYIGWDFFQAGWHKLTGAPSWLDSSAAIRGFWTSAVAIPATGSPKISYDWWRGVIQALLDSHSDVWFSKLIMFGELAVGLGLIFGALVGIAAFGGILMNVSFLLSGATSSNPVLLTLGIFVILAWKVAGYMGVDRVLLPMLGTPWQGGKLLHRQTPVPTTPPLRP
jgi:thiosulfate dehydrogenase [quinone] large subunit